MASEPVKQKRLQWGEVVRIPKPPKVNYYVFGRTSGAHRKLAPEAQVVGQKAIESKSRHEVANARIGWGVELDS
jgi:hypothetical protein